MGIAVENTIVGIQGTKFKAVGPLLITHWGMSGPAILTLSSFGARKLSEMDYEPYKYDLVLQSIAWVT